VIARDGDRTVVTMANDVQTKAKDFAMVVLVDAFSAPRLVEYTDEDPCIRRLDALESPPIMHSPAAMF
jgi:hypothetical protein